MKTLITILSMIAILSCSGSKCQTTEQIAMNQNFSVKELFGNSVSNNDITISFDLDKRKVSGYSGCNNFTGDFTIDKELITFGPIASTKKMCLEETSESDLFKILSGTKVFSVKDDTLSLTDKGKETILLKAKTVTKASIDQSKTIVFEYYAVSRGYYLLISMSNDGKYITVATAPNMKPSKQSYTSEDWETLMQEMEKINLAELPNLEPPSKKFQFDGAAIATLKIYFDGKEYQTQSFDHGNPPNEIAEIVKILLSYSEKG